MLALFLSQCLISTCLYDQQTRVSNPRIGRRGAVVLRLQVHKAISTQVVWIGEVKQDSVQVVDGVMWIVTRMTKPYSQRCER